MTHKLISGTLNLFAAVSLVSGIALAGYGAPTYASLSGVGTSILSKPEAEAMLRPAADIAVVNHYAQADAAIQLIMGMLLIVLGFFLHGFVRVRDERPVHITVKPAQKKRAQWYWMEVQI